MTATQTSPQPATEQPSNQATQKGWVNTYYRYYKGKKLGPYYVRRWKVGNKLHREYVKPADVERVKAECQANREGRRRINRMLDNFNFLGQMLNRYDAGKLVTPAMEDYIRRIHHEGIYITGRPQMRRKVTRTLAKVGGEEMLVTTIFELDGTTKVFMVPFLVNLPPRVGEVPRSGDGGIYAALTNDRQSFLDRIQTSLMSVWGRTHMDCGASAPLSRAASAATSTRKPSRGLKPSGKSADESAHSIWFRPHH
jgi:hypothetical protein